MFLLNWMVCLLIYNSFDWLRNNVLWAQFPSCNSCLVLGTESSMILGVPGNMLSSVQTFYLSVCFVYFSLNTVQLEWPLCLFFIFKVLLQEFCVAHNNCWVLMNFTRVWTFLQSFCCDTIIVWDRDYYYCMGQALS